MDNYQPVDSLPLQPLQRLETSPDFAATPCHILGSWVHDKCGSAGCLEWEPLRATELPLSVDGYLYHLGMQSLAGPEPVSVGASDRPMAE